MEVPQVNVSGFLVDGVTIISKAWDFVLPLGNITIQSPKNLRKVQTAKLFKGCLSLKRYLSVWKLNLFTTCGMDIGLLLCCEKSVNHIPYDAVLHEIKTCLDLAFQAGGESPTAKRYAQIYKNSAEAFHIITCDYQLIGNNLANIVQTRMRFVVDGVPLSCFFLGQSFGQCMDLNKFTPIFQATTSLENVLETCVHLAKDVKSSGMCAAWDRGKVALGFAKQPSYEYCVAGIPGVANMYYNVTKPGKSFKMTQLKLYAEVNKHWKNNKSGKMDTESLAEFLSKQDGISAFCLTRGKLNQLLKQTRSYLNECDQLLGMTSAGNLNPFSYSSARAEFIFSFDSGPVVLEHASKYAEAFFDRLNMRKMVTFLRLGAVTAHMKKYMIPALTGMKNSLEALVKTLTGHGASFIYGIENYLHISTSEIVVNFILRGTAMSQWNLRRCNNRLARLLGFTRNNFRNRATNFVFGNGKLRISESEGGLEFCGNFQQCIAECLQHNTGFPHIKFLMQLINFCNGDVDMLIKSIFECIVCSATSIFKCKNTVRDTCKFTNFYPGYNTYVIHSANFILMMGQIGEQALAGNPLIRNMRKLLGVDMLLNPAFIELLSNFMDVQLIHYKCPLLFPVASLKKTYIIIPTLVDDQPEEVILNMYKLALIMKYPDSCIRWIYYNKLLATIVDCLKCINFEYWITFKNMDRVFSKVFEASKEMTDKKKMIDVDVMEWFD